MLIVLTFSLLKKKNAIYNCNNTIILKVVYTLPQQYIACRIEYACIICKVTEKKKHFTVNASYFINF